MASGYRFSERWQVGQKRRFLSCLPLTRGKLDGKAIGERIITETTARGEIDRLHRDLE